MPQFNEFVFREDGKLVITQKFSQSIIIEGFTDKGIYTFEYKLFESEEE